MAELLPVTEWPDDFAYPPEFIRAVETGLTRLEPWSVLQGEYLRKKYVGLRKRYRSRRRVPFAERQDCDDVACWDLNRGNVVIVHGLRVTRLGAAG